jgi:hypothetical protein
MLNAEQERLANEASRAAPAPGGVKGAPGVSIATAAAMPVGCCP